MNVSDAFIEAVEKIVAKVDQGDNEYGCCIMCDNEIYRVDNKPRVPHADDCPVRLVTAYLIYMKTRVALQQAAGGEI